MVKYGNLFILLSVAHRAVIGVTTLTRQLQPAAEYNQTTSRHFGVAGYQRKIGLQFSENQLDDTHCPCLFGGCHKLGRMLCKVETKRVFETITRKSRDDNSQ